MPSPTVRYTYSIQVPRLPSGGLGLRIRPGEAGVHVVSSRALADEAAAALIAEGDILFEVDGGFVASEADVRVQLALGCNPVRLRLIRAACFPGHKLACRFVMANEVMLLPRLTERVFVPAVAEGSSSDGSVHLCGMKMQDNLPAFALVPFRMAGSGVAPPLPAPRPGDVLLAAVGIPPPPSLDGRKVAMHASSSRVPKGRQGAAAEVAEAAAPAPEASTVAVLPPLVGPRSPAPWHFETLLPFFNIESNLDAGFNAAVQRLAGFAEAADAEVTRLAPSFPPFAVRLYVLTLSSDKDLGFSIGAPKLGGEEEVAASSSSDTPPVWQLSYHGALGKLLRSQATLVCGDERLLCWAPPGRTPQAGPVSSLKLPWWGPWVAALPPLQDAPPSTRVTPPVALLRGLTSVDLAVIASSPLGVGRQRLRRPAALPSVSAFGQPLPVTGLPLPAPPAEEETATDGAVAAASDDADTAQLAAAVQAVRRAQGSRWLLRTAVVTSRLAAGSAAIDALQTLPELAATATSVLPEGLGVSELHGAVEQATNHLRGVAARLPVVPFPLLPLAADDAAAPATRQHRSSLIAHLSPLRPQLPSSVAPQATAPLAADAARDAPRARTPRSIFSNRALAFSNAPPPVPLGAEPDVAAVLRSSTLGSASTAPMSHMLHPDEVPGLRVAFSALRLYAKAVVTTTPKDTVVGEAGAGMTSAVPEPGSFSAHPSRVAVSGMSASHYARCVEALQAHGRAIFGSQGAPIGSIFSMAAGREIAEFLVLAACARGENGSEGKEGGSTSSSASAAAGATASSSASSPSAAFSALGSGLAMVPFFSEPAARTNAVAAPSAAASAGGKPSATPEAVKRAAQTSDALSDVAWLLLLRMLRVTTTGVGLTTEAGESGIAPDVHLLSRQATKTLFENDAGALAYTLDHGKSVAATMAAAAAASATGGGAPGAPPAAPPPPPPQPQFPVDEVIASLVAVPLPPVSSQGMPSLTPAGVLQASALTPLSSAPSFSCRLAPPPRSSALLIKGYAVRALYNASATAAAVAVEEDELAGIGDGGGASSDTGGAMVDDEQPRGEAGGNDSAVAAAAEALPGASPVPSRSSKGRVGKGAVSPEPTASPSSVAPSPVAFEGEAQQRGKKGPPPAPVNRARTIPCETTLVPVVKMVRCEGCAAWRHSCCAAAVPLTALQQAGVASAASQAAAASEAASQPTTVWLCSFCQLPVVLLHLRRHYEAALAALEEQRTVSALSVTMLACAVAQGSGGGATAKARASETVALGASIPVYALVGHLAASLTASDEVDEAAAAPLPSQLASIAGTLRPVVGLLRGELLTSPTAASSARSGGSKSPRGTPMALLLKAAAGAGLAAGTTAPAALQAQLQGVTISARVPSPEQLAAERATPASGGELLELALQRAAVEVASSMPGSSTVDVPLSRLAAALLPLLSASTQEALRSADCCVTDPELKAVAALTCFFLPAKPITVALQLVTDESAWLSALGEWARLIRILEEAAVIGGHKSLPPTAGWQAALTERIAAATAGHRRRVFTAAASGLETGLPGLSAFAPTGGDATHMRPNKGMPRVLQFGRFAGTEEWMISMQARLALRRTEARLYARAEQLRATVLLIETMEGILSAAAGTGVSSTSNSGRGEAAAAEEGSAAASSSSSSPAPTPAGRGAFSPDFLAALSGPISRLPRLYRQLGPPLDGPVPADRSVWSALDGPVPTRPGRLWNAWNALTLFMTAPRPLPPPALTAFRAATSFLFARFAAGSHMRAGAPSALPAAPLLLNPFVSRSTRTRLRALPSGYVSVLAPQVGKEEDASTVAAPATSLTPLDALAAASTSGLRRALLRAGAGPEEGVAPSPSDALTLAAAEASGAVNGSRGAGGGPSVAGAVAALDAALLSVPVRPPPDWWPEESPGGTLRSRTTVDGLCSRPGCGKPALPLSKYCSTACGVAIAHARLTAALLAATPAAAAAPPQQVSTPPQLLPPIRPPSPPRTLALDHSIVVMTQRRSLRNCRIFRAVLVAWLWQRLEAADALPSGGTVSALAYARETPWRVSIDGVEVPPVLWRVPLEAAAAAAVVGPANSRGGGGGGRGKSRPKLTGDARRRKAPAAAAEDAEDAGPDGTRRSARPRRKRSPLSNLVEAADLPPYVLEGLRAAEQGEGTGGDGDGGQRKAHKLAGTKRKRSQLEDNKSSGTPTEAMVPLPLHESGGAAVAADADADAVVAPPAKRALRCEPGLLPLGADNDDEGGTREGREGMQPVLPPAAAASEAKAAQSGTISPLLSQDLLSPGSVLLTQAPLLPFPSVLSPPPPSSSSSMSAAASGVTSSDATVTAPLPPSSLSLPLFPPPSHALLGASAGSDLLEQEAAAAAADSGAGLCLPPAAAVEPLAGVKRQRTLSLDGDGTAAIMEATNSVQGTATASSSSSAGGLSVALGDLGWVAPVDDTAPPAKRPRLDSLTDVLQADAEPQEALDEPLLELGAAFSEDALLASDAAGETAASVAVPPLTGPAFGMAFPGPHASVTCPHCTDAVPVNALAAHVTLGCPGSVRSQRGTSAGGSDARGVLASLPDVVSKASVAHSYVGSWQVESGASNSLYAPFSLTPQLLSKTREGLLGALINHANVESYRCLLGVIEDEVVGGQPTGDIVIARGLLHRLLLDAAWQLSLYATATPLPGPRAAVALVAAPRGVIGPAAPVYTSADAPQEVLAYPEALFSGLPVLRPEGSNVLQVNLGLPRRELPLQPLPPPVTLPLLPVTQPDEAAAVPAPVAEKLGAAAGVRRAATPPVSAEVASVVGNLSADGSGLVVTPLPAPACSERFRALEVPAAGADAAPLCFPASVPDPSLPFIPCGFPLSLGGWEGKAGSSTPPSPKVTNSVDDFARLGLMALNTSPRIIELETEGPVVDAAAAEASTSSSGSSSGSQLRLVGMLQLTPLLAEAQKLLCLEGRTCQHPRWGCAAHAGWELAVLDRLNTSEAHAQASLAAVKEGFVGMNKQRSQNQGVSQRKT